MKSQVSLFLLFLSTACAHSAERVPPVFLTHFNIALDQATYDALRNSAQIAALAAVEERHTTAGDHQWTGLYVYGRQTYMEFYGANDLPDDMRLGDCGLGLTVEEAGGVDAIATRLRKTFGKDVWVQATPRTTPAGTIPWFTSTGVDNGKPYALGTWFMEIDPSYLAARHPDARIDRPLSRQQYLSWDYRPDRALDNVTAITVALNPSESAQLAAELERVGWKVHPSGGGLQLVGPDIRLNLQPAGARAGITQVEIRLSHSVPKNSVEIGKATLVLNGTAGRINF